MPGRYLREGILTSGPVNQLTPQAELFYRRLMSVVDDHGRFFADPLLLRSYCFPMKPDIRATDIALWLAACEKHGLLACYECDSVRYLVFAKLGEARAKTSRYPDPPECLTVANICTQVRADVPDNEQRTTVPNNGNGQRTTSTTRDAPGDSGFAEFWQAYPNKKGRGDAEKAWVKMKCSELLPKILVAIRAAKTSDDWTKEGGRYRPHPATWLNRKGWEDEYEPAHKNGNGMREDIKCPIIKA